MSLETIAVSVMDADRRSASGVVEVRHFVPRERWLRALKWLGICWGAAAVSILLPVAHFFLVPGFFLAGIFYPFYIYGVKGVVIGGEGKCPKCEAALTVRRANCRWSLTEICQSCRADLTMRRFDNSSGQE